MQLLNSWTRTLILVLALTVGCNSKPVTPTTDSSEDGGVAMPSADGTKSKKSLVPVKRNVKVIDGNWVVVVTNKRSDNYRWIVKFSRESNGKVVGQFLDTSRDNDEHDKPQIVATDVDGDAVRLSFKNAHGTFDFVGTFQQGFIRGTIRSSPVDVYLTRLLPTDETSLEGFDANGLPPGTGTFDPMMKSKDINPDELLNAARENQTSPLAQDIFASLISGYTQARFDEAKIQELIDAYLSSAKVWGDRWEARAEMTIAVSLINGRQYSQWALAHLDAAERKFGDDRVAVAEALGSFRDAANVNIRVQDIMSPSSADETKAAAYTELTELLKKQRFNSEILFALATQAERTGQTDAALEYLAEIVALPLLEATILRARAGQPPDTPTPTELLKKLWTQKYGTEDGYRQHVEEVYQRKINEYLAEIQAQGPALPAADAGNKTVLVELFTGMQCPPCVAADLALSALSRSFPPSEVIVIRHHQHIPLPDGLVNQESEERGAAYETGGTPTAVVDGNVIESRFYAGPIQVATGAYSVFRKLVDPRLSLNTDIVLQLSAVVTDGQLNVTAVATGVPDDLLPSCRLRMAVVENDVLTVIPEGSNGIRNHELLVREMLGGAKGIPPKRGELKYSTTMPVADLQLRVTDYIKRYEAGRRFEFPEEMKPPIRGPLSLVAWVQNDKVDKEAQAKLVLQAALVPITGETGFGAEMKSARTAERIPASQEKPASDAPATDDAARPNGGSGPIPPPPALPE